MYIKETKDSPLVNLSIADCIFEIKGNSYYVGLNKLYDKIYNWFETEMPNLSCELNVTFHFKVINSASLKNIIDIINKFEAFYLEGKLINITWICNADDTDIIDIANDFAAITELPFNVVERH